MMSLFGLGRLWIAACFLSFWLLIAGVARADDVNVPEEVWQKVITLQIEAFRHGDAPAAFSLAGASFQKTFPNAFVFFQVIIGSGYAPIMESETHTFGKFLRNEDSSVLQVVKFLDPSQQLYEAIYRVSEEPGGWRVQGVILTRHAGMGV